MALREPSENFVKRLLEPTWQVSPQIQKTLAEIHPSGKICDLGAGGRKLRPGVVCVDLAPGPGVDIVADIHEVPLPDQEFELVICTGTLNLCERPKQVLSECFRLLKPGGLFHLEVGMFQPYNPEPEDYWRWTLAGLRKIHSEVGFEEHRAGPHIGPMAALSCAAIYVTGRVFDGGGVNRLLRGASHAVFGPMKYLDGLLSQDTLDKTPFAYGNYYVGRRP